MAEKLKDAEDRLLESLFAAPAVADDGFSDKIVRRLQRRLWLRRLTVPVAGIVGGAVAFKPITGLAALLGKLSALLPQEIVNSAVNAVPQVQVIIPGVVLLAACLLGMRLLEE